MIYQGFRFIQQTLNISPQSPVPSHQSPVTNCGFPQIMVSCL
ncbi:MAG: hypothetical protein ACKO9I_07210 [Sphaerospermopsis kisseleviana]